MVRTILFKSTKSCHHRSIDRSKRRKKKTSKNNFRSMEITLKIDRIKSKITGQALSCVGVRDLKLSFDSDPPLVNRRNR